MDYKVVFIIAAMLATVYGAGYGQSANYPHKQYQDRNWSSNCVCARIYAPICASDGRTYNNNCEFNCRYNFVLRKYGVELFIVKTRRCEEK